MYRIALFDIDGTLCDPGTGIVDAARHALRQIGIREDDSEALRRFVGPPLEHSLRDLYALTPAQVGQAVAAYRDHYSTNGMALYRPYPGIDAVLGELAGAGVRLGVVTAKIQQFAEQALRATGLDTFFELVAARAPDEVVPKTVTLRRALAELAADHRDVVMIGDREHDVHAAHDNDVHSIGVLYGYGTRSELTAAGATYLAAEPADIASHVLRAAA